MKNTDSLVVWDIDNTLLKNWKGWDMTFESLGKALTGQRFSMTLKPDGTFDTEFSRKSPWQIMCERFAEIGVSTGSLKEHEFYYALGLQGSQISYDTFVEPFVGVREFVKGIMQVSSRQMAIVSSGPRQMQVPVLRAAGLLDLFNLEASSFGGEFESKTSALGYRAHAARPDKLMYVGDAPSDMTAVLSAHCDWDVSRKLAVGVTMAGLSTSEELRAAGAHFIIEAFDHSTMIYLQELITS